MSKIFQQQKGSQRQRASIKHSRINNCREDSPYKYELNSSRNNRNSVNEEHKHIEESIGSISHRVGVALYREKSWAVVPLSFSHHLHWDRRASRGLLGHFVRSLPVSGPDAADRSVENGRRRHGRVRRGPREWPLHSWGPPESPQQVQSDHYSSWSLCSFIQHCSKQSFCSNQQSLSRVTAPTPCAGGTDRRNHRQHSVCTFCFWHVF